MPHTHTHTHKIICLGQDKKNNSFRRQILKAKKGIINTNLKSPKKYGCFDISGTLVALFVSEILSSTFFSDGQKTEEDEDEGEIAYACSWILFCSSVKLTPVWTDLSGLCGCRPLFGR